jgi:hypothetical protein
MGKLWQELKKGKGEKTLKRQPKGKRKCGEMSEKVDGLS